MQALYNGFGGGSLHGTNQAAPAPNQPQHFNHPQPQVHMANFSLQLNFHTECLRNILNSNIYAFVIQGVSMQAQNFGAPGAAVVNQAPAAGGSSGGASAGQPRQRVRARRGQATDPHSIAERVSCNCTEPNWLKYFYSIAVYSKMALSGSYAEKELQNE